MMNKAILSVVALLVLFIIGGLLLQNTINPITNEEVAGTASKITVPTPNNFATDSEETIDVSDDTMSVVEEVTELKIEDITIGTGTEAKAGSIITVNYKGTLLDGTIFDSSYDRNEPFIFELGSGRVIEGWDKGFDGMKEGGKRKLTIPADMAYGNVAIGKIPANSPLVFEVELLKVE